MTRRFPGESDAYRSARGRLLRMELELRRSMEVVAVARRTLPPGGALPADYAFEGLQPDGSHGDVRLSTLFTPGGTSLAIYSFMFPRSIADDRAGPTSGATASLPLHEGPCPSCTALLDQLDGAARHACDRMALVVVAKAPLPRLLALAEERGWRYLRLLSSAATTYDDDYHATLDGSPWPMLNVFERDG